jgi:hypothetical protein
VNHPVLVAIAAVCLLAACRTEPEPETPAAPERAAAGPAVFRDATAEAGLDFVHFNGMSGELYFCEMVGPGAALFDYDGDGDLDVFLVQGHMLGAAKEVADALFPPRHPLPLTDRLYRNDTAPGAALRFTDVTAEAGFPANGSSGYGMGVAAGDFDNDGRVDLYVTALGSNRLLKNVGGGAFADVTGTSGADDGRWSVSAVFFDYDRDGFLDLYVGNYVSYSVATDKRCRAATGMPDYCGPHSYEPEPDRLFRNRGDGTFEDVSAEAGIDREYGAALGVTVADLDADGWLDVYVANDGSANQMWMSRGPGKDGRVTFANEALLGGSAYNRDGNPEAGMGVAAGDYDNDGDEDLILSHLTQETNTLYDNSGEARFEDATLESGLGAPSWEMTGFGAGFVDYDNDGWLDVLVVNGAVKLIEALVRSGDPYPLHQENHLFHNLGGERFEEIAGGGEATPPSEVSRGAAFGDVDNDGDTDVLVVNNNGPARLLVNEVGHRRHWLGLRLADGEGRRDLLGAWIEAVTPDGTPQSLRRRSATGGSYASASDPRVLVGLGSSAAVSEVRVTWPSGRRETFSVPGVDRYLTLREGTGEALD